MRIFNKSGELIWTTKEHLRGVNLCRANLVESDLSGADMSGSNLSGADLQYADLRWANLSGANLNGADLYMANLSGVNLQGAIGLPKIEKMPIRKAIGDCVLASPENLSMEDFWHTCETVHCLAGWAVTLHPQGKELEARYGTSAAAALIFHACEGEVPDFYMDKGLALEWLKK